MTADRNKFGNAINVFSAHAKVLDASSVHGSDRKIAIIERNAA